MNREPKQSQLDYLWINYGNRKITTEKTDNLDDIPSLGLINNLLKEITSNAVSSVERNGNFIIIKSLEGVEITRFDIKNLSGVTSVVNFGRRVVTAEDKESGCNLDLYAPVYFIKLDNGVELLTLAETYRGDINGTVQTFVQDNIIYSRLKLSENEDNGIILKEEEDGLSGEIFLDGSDTGLCFAIKTERAYNSLKEVKKNTLYFIKDRPYIYFNEYRIGSENEVDVKHLIEEAIQKEQDRAIKAESKIELTADTNSQELKTLFKNIQQLSVEVQNKQESGDYIEQSTLEGYVTIQEYNTLKENYSTFRTWTENMLKSDTDTVTDIEKGGEFTFVKDIKAIDEVTLTVNTDLNLDGHTLSAIGGSYGDNVIIKNGANVTISNGEIAPADKANLGDQSATIMIKTDSESHLTLNNTKVTGIYPIYLNSANENSSVIINGGEYYSSYADNPSVYVGKGSSTSTIGGKVIIYKGTFGQKGVKSPYLLNVQDILRKQEGKEPRNFIEVFGGTFINFDPSDNIAEGEHTNFVADGYTIEVITDNEDTIYKVVPIE